MDWEAVQKVGGNTFLLVSICGGAFWLVKATINILTAYLHKMHESMMTILHNHELERQAWNLNYQKMAERVDNAMVQEQIQHEKMMGMISRIESRSDS